ncbi:MAG TPA: hypothetical protein VGA61_10705 [Anaerolineae bacterium]
MKWNDIIAWPAHGAIEAKTAEIALRIARDRFGGRPVLEEIQEPVHYVG